MTSSTSIATECPTCGRAAKLVKPLTLRALLRKEIFGRVVEGEYRFCDAKDCDIVYFGEGRRRRQDRRAGRLEGTLQEIRSRFSCSGKGSPAR